MDNKFLGVLLSIILVLMLAQQVIAQAPVQHTVIHFRDMAGQPVRAIQCRLRASDGSLAFQGMTNTNGECIVDVAVAGYILTVQGVLADGTPLAVDPIYATTQGIPLFIRTEVPRISLLIDDQGIISYAPPFGQDTGSQEQGDTPVFLDPVLVLPSEPVQATPMVRDHIMPMMPTLVPEATPSGVAATTAEATTNNTRMLIALLLVMVALLSMTLLLIRMRRSHTP